MQRNPIYATLEALRDHGPLGTLWRILTKAGPALQNVPLAGRATFGLTRLVRAYQQSLDRRFDRLYGTDTADIIQTKDLQIERGSVVLGNRYEPVTRNIFDQIMRQVDAEPRHYKCIDLGSGKGRGLIMAAEYGFPSVVGVEYARDLHVIAERNIKLFEQRIGRPSGISVICQDAQEYEIPPGNLFFFLYSPFWGSVMECVVKNIRESYQQQPRPIVIVFYGENRETLQDLDSLRFRKKEIPLRADWTRFNMYRVWIYTSSEADAMRGS